MSTDKPCIAVLQATFNEDGQNTPEYAEYSQRSNANGQAYGGQLLGRYVIDQNLGQGEAPHAVFVVEFPSRKVAETAFTNDEYTSIIPLRDVAFKKVKILLSDNYEN